MKYIESEMICTICNQRGIPVPRKEDRKRERNHIKHMYCVHCKKKTPHREIRNIDFVDEGGVGSVNQRI